MIMFMDTGAIASVIEAASMQGQPFVPSVKQDPVAALSEEVAALRRKVNEHAEKAERVRFRAILYEGL